MLCRLLRLLFYLVFTPACLIYDVLRLIAKLCRKVTMLFQHFFARKKILAVSCSMSCDLSGSSTFTPDLLKMLFDLRTPWTRCLQILL